MQLLCSAFGDASSRDVVTRNCLKHIVTIKDKNSIPRPVRDEGIVR